MKYSPCYPVLSRRGATAVVIQTTSILFLLFFLFPFFLYANNISISNPRLTEQNIKAHTVKIEFDISWENSFRMNTGPANWDAAWVFVKYRVAKASGGDGTWRHVKLNLTGHSTDATSTISSTPEGVFIYRTAIGTGTFNAKSVKLLWNYGIQIEKGENDFLDDDDAIDIRVFGIEMVYIPGNQSFNVGGGGGNMAFNSTDINTANAAIAGQGYPAGVANTNPKFPNGYNAFYCMKYEISQKQYADFLNALPYGMQNRHTNAFLGSPSGSSVLYFYMLSSPQYKISARNGIKILVPSGTDSAAVLACNLDNDLSFDEPEDGQSLACNWLNFYKVWAFLDWSGLRPMTELEYEKACRGPVAAVAGEFAWGSPNIQASDSILFPGTDGETPENKTANVNSGFLGYSNNSGPMRVGAFARPGSTRVVAGATYYGILDMTGNLREVTVLAAANPTYTGLHGDGELGAGGDYNVPFWPNQTSASPYFDIIYRGSAAMGVSTRASPLFILDIDGQPTDGGRGVRSAP